MNTNDVRKKEPRIGEVYLIYFDGTTGSEQRGWRPGLVFQNNTGNQHSPNIIALPLTTSIKKTNQPTHVLLYAKDTGLKRDSVVLCENPERISKQRLGKYLTTIPESYMSKIAVANMLATSAISFIDPGILQAIWNRARALNAVA